MSPKDLRQLDKELSKAEGELVKWRQKVAELRQQRPPEKLQDYTFKTTNGNELNLSKLFGGKKDLILIHNMGKKCPYCTMWADGFNGVLQHLENRAAFAVVSPDEPATIKEFAAGRGWRFNILSSRGSSFTKEMDFETEEGEPMPGVSAFQKDEQGRLFRVSRAGFGPGDDYCAVWHIFDLLADGSNDWHPKFSY